MSGYDRLDPQKNITSIGWAIPPTADGPIHFLVKYNFDAKEDSKYTVMTPSAPYGFADLQTIWSNTDGVVLRASCGAARNAASIESPTGSCRVTRVSRNLFTGIVRSSTCPLESNKSSWKGNGVVFGFLLTQ